MAENNNGTVDIRVLTANIQSFPPDAITLAQAREDLRQNADVADIVLLQEIADRYRHLVEEAFPAPEWEVFFGRKDNSEPIAYRRSMFHRLEGQITQLHPPRAGIHGRRFITHLHLSAEPSGTDFHVTNLHMVARAFSKPPAEHRALRVKEWHEGIAKHLTQIDELVESGAAVLGGGDYNRQLKQHPSLGQEIGGQEVRYAVDDGSIDLLWFINGDGDRWSLRSRELFAGSKDKHPRRNSDHGARLATLQLGGNGSAPVESAAISTASNGAHGPTNNDHPKGKGPKNNGPKKNPKPKAKPTAPERKWPPPFQKTTFGIRRAREIDWKTRAALEVAERKLGFKFELFQGSYNPGGVDASSHTHDLGGVVDIVPRDHARMVKVLREIGFAAWFRGNMDPPHVHAVLIDHGNLHESAARQVVDYRKGLDGLEGDDVDHTPRPKPIPIFKYPPKTAQPKAKDDSVEGHHDGKAIAKAKVDAIPQLGPPFPPRRTLDGVDTSHYQSGKIDLRKAQHAGLRFWYVKTTEGSTLQDKTYKRRIREARKAGVPVGSYHYASPDGGDAVKEANFFLKNSDIRLGDMLPMLDLEGRQVLNRAELTRWVGVWVTTVRGDLARRGLVGNPIIYTKFHLDDAFGCKLWVARYSNEFIAPVIPEPWKRAAIWQHSDGKDGPILDVPGFGAVDVNAMHPELPLSALRVRRPQKGGTDLDEIRRDLTMAKKRIDDALKRLPER